MVGYIYIYKFEEQNQNSAETTAAISDFKLSINLNYIYNNRYIFAS